MEIEKNSILICEFLKLKGDYSHNTPYGYRYLHTDNYWRLPSRMKYHSSWDWLMPVVEKISQLDIVKETAVKSTGTRIWLNKSQGYVQQNSDERTMISDCFSTVIKFIIWYNNYLKELEEEKNRRTSFNNPRLF